VLSVAAFQILIVSTKPATTVTRMFVAAFTIPPHAAMKMGVSKTKKDTSSITIILIKCQGTAESRPPRGS
jgi:hypothetical protein